MAERKHYFFDMDGTLTESRSVCSPEMKQALIRIANTHDVVIVSGADHGQIRKQLPFLPQRSIYVLAQSGNVATKGWKKLWRKRLNRVHKAVISEHIRVLKSIAPAEPAVKDDIVQDRGGQISYSIIGHNAPKEEKDVFDPKGAIRRKLLQEWPLRSSACQVRLGGTTSLDYTATGWGKDGNCLELITREGWKIEDCRYIGDQFYDGGNDADVIHIFGVRNCYVVTSPADTLKLIHRINQDL